MSKKYTDEEVLKLIGEVEKEFTVCLKKGEENLEHEASETPEQETAEEAPEAPAETPVAPEASAEAPAEAPADFDYDEQDMEEMQKMYSSMGPQEQEAHLNALKTAMGIDEQAPAQAEAPAAAPAPEAAPADLSMVKSENDTLKSKNAELETKVAAMSNFLTALNKKAPAQKAITEMNYIRKSEEGTKELTKAEIDAKLNAQARLPSLSKSDRDAINNFYLVNAPVETIKHLLK